MKKIFTLLLLLFAVFAVNINAQVIYGPAAEPPEGVFMEVVGDLHDQLIGRAAGKDITFSAMPFANRTRLFFGAQDSLVILSLDGPVYQANEHLVYSPTLSVPENGYLVWTGVTKVPDRINPVYSRFVMKITDPVVGGPIAATDSLLEIASGSSFHVNLQFQASYREDAGFEPHLDFYDRESVTDGLAYSSFNWGWYWENSAPQLRVNNEVPVDEGDTVVLDIQYLMGVDVESDSSEIYFTVEELPVNGTLELNRVTFDVSDTFTQEDLDSTLVYYVHDGSETLSDSVGLRLSDGDGAYYAVGDDTTFYLKFVITPVNDPPLLVTNDPLTLDEGAGVVIGSELLLSEDAEGDPVNYTFDPNLLGEWPKNGILKLDGVPLSSGDVFTQTDINDGKLTYKHDGTETTVDGFVFKTADTDGHSTGIVSFFDVSITLTNDPPRFTANSTTEVVVWEKTVITSSNIAATDEESDAAHVSFVLPVDGTVTGNGSILLNDVALSPGESFTMQDILDGVVAYFVGVNAQESDFLLFEIYDEDGAVASDNGFTVFKHNFNVTLTGVNKVQLNSLNVYPNPGNGYFQITWEGSFDSYTVINATGQVIAKERIQSQYNMSLDLTEYGSGMYILKMNNLENESIIKKLIVQ